MDLVLRFILLVLIAYLVWKLVKPLFHRLRTPSGSAKTTKQRDPFGHIEEADFEDITPKDSEDQK